MSKCWPCWTLLDFAVLRPHGWETIQLTDPAHRWIHHPGLAVDESRSDCCQLGCISAGGADCSSPVRWIAFEFKKHQIRVGSPWSDCSVGDSTPTADAYTDIGTIIPVSRWTNFGVVMKCSSGGGDRGPCLISGHGSASAPSADGALLNWWWFHGDFRYDFANDFPGKIAFFAIIRYSIMLYSRFRSLV